MKIHTFGSYVTPLPAVSNITSGTLNETLPKPVVI